MSYRGSTARKGSSPMEITLGGLASGLEALAKRVRKIEQSNRTVPPELRFDVERDDAGNAYLVVERVTTGNRERISGPL